MCMTPFSQSGCLRSRQFHSVGTVPSVVQRLSDSENPGALAGSWRSWQVGCGLAGASLPFGQTC